VSEWAWEYLPDAESVVAGLPAEVIKKVEEVAAELAVVNSMVYLDGANFTGSGPGLRIVNRPHLLISYLTDVRGEAIYVVRVNYVGEVHLS
jgi:hypothetical protein